MREVLTGTGDGGNHCVVGEAISPAPQGNGCGDGLLWLGDGVTGDHKGDGVGGVAGNAMAYWGAGFGHGDYAFRLSYSAGPVPFLLE